MIKVLINGACGRMGCEVEKLVDAAEDIPFGKYVARRCTSR